MIDLTGKTALVTGSSRGIGKACALRLAEAGADVVINYVSSRSAAMDVAAQIIGMGRQAYVIKADVGEEEDVESMMEFLDRTIGKLDIIICNAATGGFRPLLESRPNHFATAMRINAFALVALVRHGLPLLQKAEGRGKVIAISSHGSHLALPDYGLIGGSKAALESLCRHMTLEVGDRGVNLNVVKAGIVATDSTKRSTFNQDMFAGRGEKTMMGGRDLAAEDVANVVLYLASPLSDLVQGETITVDGGAAIHI